MSEQGSYSRADDALSGYNFLRLTPGKTYTISALRQEFDLDPGMWIFEEHRSYQNFIASGDVSSNGSFNYNIAGYLGSADDVIQHPGPYSDPQLVITAPASGKVTVVVTNVASGSNTGGDGRFDYQVTVEGPNGEAAFDTKGGGGFFGDDPTQGSAFPGEEQLPSIEIDFSDSSLLESFRVEERGDVALRDRDVEENNAEAPFIELYSNGSSAESLGLTQAIEQLWGGEAVAGSTYELGASFLSGPLSVDEVVVSFDWRLVTDEGLLGDESVQDDTAFYATSDGQLGVLTSVDALSPATNSGWQTTTLTIHLNPESLEAFSFRLGVVNIGDNEGVSRLAVDNITLVGVSEDDLGGLLPPVPF